MAMAALGPVPPSNLSVSDVPNGLAVNIDDPNNYGIYRVGVRSTDNDWDSVYTLFTTVDTLWGLVPGESYKVTACTVDGNGVESLFSFERIDNFAANLNELGAGMQGVELLQNKPNPFDEATTISVYVSSRIDYSKAEIVVQDIQGRIIKQFPITLEPGVNDVMYWHHFSNYQSGVYAYTLLVDGKPIATRQMVFAW